MASRSKDTNRTNYLCYYRYLKPSYTNFVFRSFTTCPFGTEMLIGRANETNFVNSKFRCKAAVPLSAPFTSVCSKLLGLFYGGLSVLSINHLTSIFSRLYCKSQELKKRKTLNTKKTTETASLVLFAWGKIQHSRASLSTKEKQTYRYTTQRLAFTS